MFKGLPGDQFRQFIASSRTSPIPQLPVSFPHLHGSSNNNTAFPSFDSYTTSSHHHQQVPFQPNNNFLHQLHQVPPPTPASKSHHEGKLENDNNMVGMNLEIINGRERIAMIQEDPWSSDELLGLLRVRSSMENWFPEFTWEHVSRKLADLGFKRSPERCREKFEEESRYFSNINNDNFNKNNNYRVFGELEELYNEGPENPHDQEEDAAENSDKITEKPNEEEKQGEEDKVGQEESRNDHQETADKAEEDNARKNMDRDSKGRKRKRSSSEKRFEMFKGFCEGIVHQILAQQEEMHVKLLEDMVRRDEEKVAREEEWKRQEMDRITKELELRAREQARAGDRQATIIKFLKKFTSSSSGSSVEVPGERRSQDPVDQVPISSITNSNPSIDNAPSSSKNPNPTRQINNKQSKQEAAKLFTMALGHQKNSHESLSPQNPTSSPDHQISTISKVPIIQAPPNPTSPSTENHPSAASTPSPTSKVPKNATSNDKEGLGKRWPRDEVLALINLRRSLFKSNDQVKEGEVPKAPLWERISKGMLELGYKKSAKRCKEKWENINKYFRKTKDLSKKRSVDSRTCPYFHHLYALYNQGTLAAPAEGSKSCPESP